MDIHRLQAIGERHASLGTLDRVRFAAVQRYVEEVVQSMGGNGSALPEDIEQRIERVVAARLEEAFGDILARLGTLEEDMDAVKAEIQRRRGGRPKKAGA